jgi:hypothetical protein
MTDNRMFYVREAHGISRSRQVNAAKARGIPSNDIWIEGRTDWENLDNMIDHPLRPGYTLEVVRAVVLAEPMSKGNKRPSDKLHEVVQRLHRGQITVYETETGRTCADPAHLTDMIFEAVRHLAKPVAAKGKAGAPAWQKPEPALYEAAKAAWKDTVAFRSNLDAVKAIQERPDLYGGPWSKTNLYRQFGPSGRKSSGRPKSKT